MNTKILNYTIVPSTIEEDYSQDKTTWVNGKIFSIDEGTHITYYIGHYEETIIETHDIEGVEREVVERVITRAYSIRIPKPFSMEKILMYATMNAYRISIDEYASFLNEINNKLQANSGDSEGNEYRSFIEWVRNSIDGTFKTKVDEEKALKLAEIDAYDKSDSVNTFYLSGAKAWFDKGTRVGLMNSTKIAKDMGEETTTLWYGSYSFVIPCDAAIQMLSELEIYALNCYNKTAEHKAKVAALETVDEIKNYNYKEGYPTCPSFDLAQMISE